MTVAAAGFEECFRAQFPQLVALGESMTGDRAIAHDIAQEALLRLHDRWDTVSAYDRPEAWLRRVASNLLIDHHRSRAAERRAIERLAVGVPRTDGSADPASDDLDGWFRLLAQLPPRQRLIASLFYGFDRSIADIAADLGVSENTIKSSLSKARSALRSAEGGRRV